MSKNKQNVVIVSMEHLNNLKDQIEWEIKDTKESLVVYAKEKKLGTLKVLSDPQELLAA